MGLVSGEELMGSARAMEAAFEDHDIRSAISNDSWLISAARSSTCLEGILHVHYKYCFNHFPHLHVDLLE